MKKVKTGTRFSGADWADQLTDVTIVGVGGIGSWTAINISRIGHELCLVDPDVVDITNTTGGQMYRTRDVNRKKVDAIQEICREMGGTAPIFTVDEFFSEEIGVFPIVITGLDNMKARKEVFEVWNRQRTTLSEKELEEVGCKGTESFLLIDGRLLMEHIEIFVLRGDDERGIKEYQEEHLFDDSAVPDTDCTTKQTTFAAMMIAGMITTVLCNWLTNMKLGENFREVPFHQNFHLPNLMYRKSSDRKEEEIHIQGLNNLNKLYETTIENSELSGRDSDIAVPGI